MDVIPQANPFVDKSDIERHKQKIAKLNEKTV